MGHQYQGTPWVPDAVSQSKVTPAGTIPSIFCMLSSSSSPDLHLILNPLNMFRPVLSWFLQDQPSTRFETLASCHALWHYMNAAIIQPMQLSQQVVRLNTVTPYAIE